MSLLAPYLKKHIYEIVVFSLVFRTIHFPSLFLTSVDALFRFDDFSLSLVGMSLWSLLMRRLDDVFIHPPCCLNVENLA